MCSPCACTRHSHSPSRAALHLGPQLVFGFSRSQHNSFDTRAFPWGVSPSLRLGKVFFPFNSQIVQAKTFLSKRFSVIKISLKWNSQVIVFFWNMFGLALGKALASFRHDLGFSADAHRHQVSLGLSFKQVGLWFIYPLSFGSSLPHSRLFRLNVN